MTQTARAYEIRNPSFPDMDLEAQIAVGVNDWAVDGRSGHRYYGVTPEAAVAMAATYDFK